MAKRCNCLPALLALGAVTLASCAPNAASAPPAVAVAEAPAANPVAIGVDPRVELFMTIFRLAGASEFARGNPRYTRALDAHFAAFADHPAVAMAKRLREERGMGFNAVPELGVSVGPLPALAEEVPLERQAHLDPRWTLADARAFLAAARDFARVSNAAAFFQSQRPLFELLDRRMANLVRNEADLDWIRKFYGDPGRDRFVIVPSMLAFQGNYGPEVLRPDGSRELYAIIGVAAMDEDQNPALGISQAFTLVHEFGHSFVNPLILTHKEELAPAAAALRNQSKDAMATIGYQQDIVVLYETIIRAGVARYKLAHSGPEIAERELERNRKLGFVWIDEFYKILGDYEADREHYPDLAAFYPVMKARIEALPAKLSAIAAAYDARRPKIVAVEPALEAGPIDPATKAIRIRFDRPIAQSWGFNMNASDLIPDARIHLEEGDTVMVIEVSLKPGKSYELPFFASGENAVRGRDDGVPLAATTLRFKTRARR